MEVEVWDGGLLGGGREKRGRERRLVVVKGRKRWVVLVVVGWEGWIVVEGKEGW